MASYLTFCTSLSGNNTQARIKHFDQLTQIPQEPQTDKVAILVLAKTNDAPAIGALHSRKVAIVSLEDGSHHLMISHCLNNGFSFVFSTSKLMENAVDLFAALKENHYSVKIVYVGDDDPDHKRDLLEKCVPHVQEIDFYSGDRLGLRWIRLNDRSGSGEMHHFNTYRKVRESFGDKWKDTFEVFPFSIEFMNGAGLP